MSWFLSALYRDRNTGRAPRLMTPIAPSATTISSIISRGDSIMKHATRCWLVLGLGLVGSDAAHAELLSASGVTCQPATSADAAKLDYTDGHPANIYSAPGTTAQMANVVCPLPSTPPGYVMAAATAYFTDFSDRRWSKCTFMNGYATDTARIVMTVGISPGSHIGRARLVVDPATLIPFVVRCPIRPGQTLYALETELTPLP
jgi:hypothetical protein